MDSKTVFTQLFAFWRRAGWTEFLTLAGVCVFCLGIWIFEEMSDYAVPGNTLELDAKILRVMRDPNDPSRGMGPAWLPPVAIFITNLGSTTMLTALPVLATAYLFWRRQRRAAAYVACASLGGLVLILLLKHLFGRPRPDVVPHLVQVTSTSFPSGHSMMSAVIYLSLAVLLFEAAGRRRMKAFLIPLALALSGLIGLSRVYLGVHYPTDVVGGWAAGTAWALLCWGTAHFMRERGQY